MTTNPKARTLAMAKMGSSLSLSLSNSRSPCGASLRATAEHLHTHIKSYTSVIPSSNPHALVSRSSFSSSILVPSRSQRLGSGFGALRIQVPRSERFILRSVLCWEAGVAGSVRGGANMVEVVESVKLTGEEERIFATLMATLKHFDLDTQLRVAGGWVRDKVRWSLSLHALFLRFFSRLLESGLWFSILD